MEQLFKVESEEEFIYWAYQYHLSKSYGALPWYDPKYPGIPPHNRTIDWLYKLGRDYNLLNISYTGFKSIIEGVHKDYWQGQFRRASSKTYRRWGYRSHFCDPQYYRVLRGFTYSGQPKKEKNSKKNEWRKYKGINRDKRKSKYNRRRTRDLKHFSARTHRALERRALMKDPDQLSSNSYKHAENPWSWD